MSKTPAAADHDQVLLALQADPLCQGALIANIFDGRIYASAGELADNHAFASDLFEILQDGRRIIATSSLPPAFKKLSLIYDSFELIKMSTKNTQTSENSFISTLSKQLDVPFEEASQLFSYLKTISNRADAENYLYDILGHGKASENFISNVMQSLFRSPAKQLVISNNNSKNQKKKSKAAPTIEPTQPNTESKRKVCTCQAAKHPLLANCLSCGKIICTLEGSGPCSFCGFYVESKEQQLKLIREVREQKKKAKLPQNNIGYGQKVGAAILSSAKLADSSNFPALGDDDAKAAQDLEKAQRQKDKLIEFDRNSVARTRVFDNASDFDYQSAVDNKWLTPEQRALALKKLQQQKVKEEESRRRRVITLDLDSNRVVDATVKYTPEKVDLSDAQLKQETTIDTSSGKLINPNLKQPIYFVSSTATSKDAPKKKVPLSQREKASKVENTPKEIPEEKKRPKRKQLNRLQSQFDFAFDDYMLYEEEDNLDANVPCG
ncbi:hypothetical protein HK098_000809 [Nowakowskiella sp. JEL0407]|nr:hypothetical protein HK098_000809 [Nowakowskiella sp. JEL0407]